jgi:hypothetical protein
MSIYLQIVYSFVIHTVGVESVGSFSNVIKEIRYHYRGMIGEEYRDRYCVQRLDVKDIDPASFVDINDVTQEQITSWLESSIDPNNLATMKQNIIEQFNPPIRNIAITFFKRPDKEIESDSNPEIDTM